MPVKALVLAVIQDCQKIYKKGAATFKLDGKWSKKKILKNIFWTKKKQKEAYLRGKGGFESSNYSTWNKDLFVLIYAKRILKIETKLIKWEPKSTSQLENYCPLLSNSTPTYNPTQLQLVGEGVDFIFLKKEERGKKEK